MRQFSVWLWGSSLTLMAALSLFACSDEANTTSGSGSASSGNPSGSSSGSTSSGTAGSGQGGMGQGGSGQGGSGQGGSGPSNVVFDRITVDAQAGGAAWITTKDLNGDGKLDMVLSRFGTLGAMGVPNGEVKIYIQGGTLDKWTPQTVVPEAQGIQFPNRTTVDDIDMDGDLDIAVPGGFLVCTAIPFGQPCGSLFWMENTGNGYSPHYIVPKNASLFYHHAGIVDFDNDGIKDLVTVGEANGQFGGPGSAEAQWFKGNASADRFEKTARKIGDGLGSLPTVADVDGDGDLDMASAEYFYPNGSFAWMERTADPSMANPNGTFVRRVINNDSGPSIMLGLVPNLYGDGRTVAVGSNHTNTAKIPADPQESAIMTFEAGADMKQPWMKTIISQGIVSAPGTVFAPQAAPGIFGWGDIDGDKDIDLAVSGDGDPKVYWMEQISAGKWEMHVLEADLPQAGGMVVADLDMDGKNEIVVTGYEANAVYIYVRQ